MRYKKVMVIQASDEIELAKKLNESEINFFATQTKQKRDGSWVAFCYYNTLNEKEETKKETKPVRRYPEKKVLATEKQIFFINKNNIDVNTENLSKEEAKRIIGEFVKEKEGKK